MPDSNFDKNLRDRLSGFEAEYNAADWKSMEAMLDGRSKKPLFLVLLFLFIIVTSGSAFVLFHDEVVDYLLVFHEKSISINQVDFADPDAKCLPDYTDDYDADVSSLCPDQSSELVCRNLPGPNLKSNNTFFTTGLTDSPTSRLVNHENNIAQEVIPSKELQILTAALDFIYCEKLALEPFLHLGEIDDNENKSSRRKTASFALGVGGEINSSFSKPISITKPGYSFGLAQELMFIDKIGLAFGQDLSKRTYQINGVKCVSRDCLVSYKSTVKSFDLIMNIKAILVNKQKWNYYMKAGIQHSFKIQESFDYTFEYPPVDTVPGPGPKPIPTQNTTFTGQDNGVEMDAFNGANNRGQVDGYSISGSKRYHAAYHFATGLDYRITTNFVIQIETGYILSTGKIHSLKSRLQSIGLNGRIFYRF